MIDYYALFIEPLKTLPTENILEDKNLFGTFFLAFIRSGRLLFTICSRSSYPFYIISY